MGGDELVREISFTYDKSPKDIVFKTRFIVLKIVLKTPATCLWPLD